MDDNCGVWMESSAELKVWMTIVECSRLCRHSNIIILTCHVEYVRVPRFSVQGNELRSRELTLCPKKHRKDKRTACLYC